jgi:energy-coupling factor transporter transmembrane protein EcfT
MKKFFFSHPDFILSAIVFVLLVILISFFSWGINDVIFEIHQSTVSSNAQNQAGFNLQGAAALGLPTNITVSTTSAVTTTATSTQVSSTLSTTTAK